MQPFLKFLKEKYDPGTVVGRIQEPKVEFNWTHPDHKKEQEEVRSQLHADNEKPFMPRWVRERMVQLSNTKAWNHAIRNGVVRQLTHDEVKASNNADKSWNAVTNEEKKNRVLSLVRSKQPLERPIYLEHPKTREKYLISGNTRSQLAHRFNLPIQAHVIQ